MSGLHIEAVRPFRACLFCVSFELGCVFADFDVDEPEGLVFARAVSFDAYGYWTVPSPAPRLDADDSRELRARVERNAWDDGVGEEILRRYFASIVVPSWEDAFREYGLLPSS